MIKYELKPEFEGTIVTRNNMSVGKVTFDATKVKPEHYQNYVKLGFQELFNEIVETAIENTIRLIVEETQEIVEDVIENIQDKKKNKKKI